MTAKLYKFQKEALTDLCGGKHFAILGCGCHAKGHPILLDNGEIVPVENIRVGDEIASASGKKKVLHLSRGRDKMYRITPIKGRAFVVNGGHVLSLHIGEKRMQQKHGNNVLLTAAEVFSMPKASRLRHAIKLKYGELRDGNITPDLDPWLIGAWIGDGDNLSGKGGTRFTNVDEPVIARMSKIVKSYGWGIHSKDGVHWYIKSAKKAGRGHLSPLKKRLVEVGIFSSPTAKKMPNNYLRWTKASRLKLLAGLLDTDGNSSENRKYDFISKDKEVGEGVCLLARSLGLHATTGVVSNGCIRVYIGGDIEQIPCVKHSPRNGGRVAQSQYTGFKIEYVGVGDYYGFTLDGDHLYLDGNMVEHHNCGKTAIAIKWAEHTLRQTKKTKLCVWTTASKSHSSDWSDELELFSPGLKKSLSSLSIISWSVVARWMKEHHAEIEDWVFIVDEAHYAKNGVSSNRGTAFLRMTARTNNWVGLTGTPGDSWLSFYPYFQATGLVKNKTAFKRDYCQIQTYKGFPEIVGYLHEDELTAMWASISAAPDTSQMMRELPPETHKVVEFKKPKGYDKVAKTRTTLDGEFLETSGAYCAELRRMCFNKDRQQWVKDFVEGLGTRAVFFYNFIATGDTLTAVIEKALPKGARVWRIDGKHHEIPTAETIGKYDVVLCQWQSGSEGLNLQHSNHWVSVEPSYSYSTSIQGRGRIRRIGQQRPQFFYYLKAKGTIEDAIYQTLKQKSDFSEDTWLAAREENNA